MTAPDLTSDGFDFDRISPDLIDRVRNSIERGGQEIQSVDLLKGRIAKSYCDGNIGLEIGLAANWEGKYHEFTCLIVPASVGHDSGGWSIAGGDVNISRLATRRLEHCIGGAHCDSQSNSMLIRSRDFTEKFENVIAADVTIPSRIGLYPSERVIKFWRDLLTPPCLSSGQAVFKVVWTVSEREVSVLALPFSDEKRCGESSLVEWPAARLGLDDTSASKDMAELRELLSAWRDAKRSALSKAFPKTNAAWVLRISNR
jgi:hypothetical protein